MRPSLHLVLGLVVPSLLLAACAPETRSPPADDSTGGGEGADRAAGSEGSLDDAPTPRVPPPPELVPRPAYSRAQRIVAEGIAAEVAAPAPAPDASPEEVAAWVAARDAGMTRTFERAVEQVEVAHPDRAGETVLTAALAGWGYEHVARSVTVAEGAADEVARMRAEWLDRARRAYADCVSDGALLPAPWDALVGYCEARLRAP